MVVAYGITGWTGMARLVRGQVLQLKSQEYIVAAEAMGAKSSRIIAKHLIPNALSVIIINVTLHSERDFHRGIPFLHRSRYSGSEPSWARSGAGRSRCFRRIRTSFIPAIAISLTMLAFNLFGDGLRDAFDPRLRR